jgi:hypothetical protein
MKELEDIDLRIKTLRQSNELIWREIYATSGELEDLKKREARILEWQRNNNEIALLLERSTMLLSLRSVDQT